MTYPGEQPPPTVPGPPVQYGPPPSYPAPQPPTRRRSWIPWTIAGVALLALVGGAAFFFLGAGGLSRDVAQRECRTALEREASQRAVQLDPGASSGIVATVKRVDLQETYETADGWTVNGTVAYTLTSALVPQVEQAVSLTCTATGTDAAAKTSVKNRS